MSQRLLSPSSCSCQITSSSALPVHCVSHAGKATTVLWCELRATEICGPLLSVQPLCSSGRKTGVLLCKRSEFGSCHLFKCCLIQASGRLWLNLVSFRFVMFLLSRGWNPGPFVCSGSTLPVNCTHSFFLRTTSRVIRIIHGLYITAQFLHTFSKFIGKGRALLIQPRSPFENTEEALASYQGKRYIVDPFLSYLSPHPCTPVPCLNTHTHTHSMWHLRVTPNGN